jgi:ABC-type iron transport system FetAB ATPase subunit
VITAKLREKILKAQFPDSIYRESREQYVAKIEKIDKDAFADLVANVRRAQALAQKALEELQNGNYTSEYKYVEKFGTNDHVYTLNKGDELVAEMDQIYSEFSNWLGSWEM